MATKTFCDECDKAFFSPDSTPFHGARPIGWVFVTVGLAPRAPPLEVGPQQVAVVGEFVTEDGKRIATRMMAQQAPILQGIAPEPEPDAPASSVTSRPLWLCPGCAEKRIADLKFVPAF